MGKMKSIPRSGLARSSNGPVPRSPSAGVRGGGVKRQGRIEVAEPSLPMDKSPGMGSTPPKVAAVGKAFMGHDSNGMPYKCKDTPLPPSHSRPVDRAEIGGLRRGRVHPKGNSETISKGKIATSLQRKPKGKMRSYDSTQKGVKRG